jgi:phospholipid N-methyltransferase
VAEIVAVARQVLPSKVVYLARCIEHLENRLAYEKAMLEDQGASALLEKKPRPVQLPLCNYRAASITYPNPWSRGEFITSPQVEMTAAEYAKIHNDYKGTREVEHSHRIRTAFVWDKDRNRTICAVFLTDSKAHKKPAPGQPPPPRGPKLLPATAYTPAPKSDDDRAFEALKETAAAGVAVVVAPQLFPTPDWLARQVVERAEIRDCDRVLEPSAGTGALVEAMPADIHLVTVEINPKLCQLLRALPGPAEVIEADFLSLNGTIGTFDRIVMNPPFTMGADVEHVAHAWRHLGPEGRLVAIMGGNTGRRSFVELVKTITDSGADLHIETLPPESFKDAGTSVNTVLLTVQKNG